MTTKICRCPKNKKGARSETERINIREASLSAMSMRPVIKKTVKVEKRIGGSKFITAFLSSAIVLLMLATSWLAYTKFEGSNDNAYRNPIVVLPGKQQKPVETDHLTKQQAEAMVAKVNERIDSMEKQMQVWNHRAWLLALAVNENANISQGIDNRYHRCHPHQSYITFDQCWKINRYPNTMHLTPEQKNSLRHNVR